MTYLKRPNPKNDSNSKWPVLYMYMVNMNDLNPKYIKLEMIQTCNDLKYLNSELICHMLTWTKINPTYSIHTIVNVIWCTFDGVFVGMILQLHILRTIELGLQSMGSC